MAEDYQKPAGGEASLRPYGLVQQWVRVLALGRGSCSAIYS
jgi:hypothetical protein